MPKPELITTTLRNVQKRVSRPIVRANGSRYLRTEYHTPSVVFVVVSSMAPKQLPDRLARIAAKKRGAK